MPALYFAVYINWSACLFGPALEEDALCLYLGPFCLELAWEEPPSAKASP